MPEAPLLPAYPVAEYEVIYALNEGMACAFKNPNLRIQTDGTYRISCGGKLRIKNAPKNSNYNIENTHELYTYMNNWAKQITILNPNLKVLDIDRSVCHSYFVAGTSEHRVHVSFQYIVFQPIPVPLFPSVEIKETITDEIKVATAPKPIKLKLKKSSP